MEGRGRVIGAVVGQIQGVDNDVRAVTALLAERGCAPVASDAVGQAISGRVQSSVPNQQPRIEGPRHRRIFSLDEEPAMAIPIQRTGATFTLEAGTLTGVAVGDVHAVVGYAAPDRELARVRVTSVTPLAASAELIPGGRTAAIPGDAVAVPRVSARPRRALAVDATADVSAQIETALARTRRLRRASATDTAIADLVVRHGDTRLIDRAGLLLPVRRFPDQLPHVLEIADRLAAARDLLDLEGAFGISPTELRVSWGVVEHGKAIAQLAHGTVVGLDAKIYVRVKNVASRELVVQLFNVGVQGWISLVSSAAVRGVALAPQQQICFGTTSTDHQLVGLEVSWPPELPRSTARLDTLLVIATTRGVDLRALETSRATGTGARGASSSPHATAARPGTAPEATPTRDPYLMTSITYLIDPRLDPPWSAAHRTSL